MGFRDLGYLEFPQSEVPVLEEGFFLNLSSGLYYSVVM